MCLFGRCLAWGSCWGWMERFVKIFNWKWTSSRNYFLRVFRFAQSQNTWNEIYCFIYSSFKRFSLKELDFARSSSTPAAMMHQENAQCAVTPTTSTDDGSLRPRMKPALPPKPQIDSYRYSMTNIQGKKWFSDLYFCNFILRIWVS